MKICFYHHIPLPVKTYGGTERILFWHMCELVKLGHEVVFIGHPDSKVEEFGITLIPLNSNDLRDNWEAFVPTDSDLLHLQFNYHNEFHIPIISTIHGNGQLGEVFPKNSVFVSGSHAKNHGSEVFVYNGFDFNEYPAPEKYRSKKDNLMFLAKASWRVKNLKDCKRAAKSLKKNLHITGGKSFSFSKYIHNYGFIGGDEKIKIMRNCDALVFPVRWNEPFGMAMVEGMTQGLAIFGSSYGSLPEVIGEAGVCSKNFADFVNSIRNWDIKLSPKQIREYALDNFSIQNYSKQYLSLYSKVINGESLSKENPKYALERRAEDLLIF